jgi:hypothetical protein
LPIAHATGPSSEHSTSEQMPSAMIVPPRGMNMKCGWRGACAPNRDSACFIAVSCAVSWVIRASSRAPLAFAASSSFSRAVARA